MPKYCVGYKRTIHPPAFSGISSRTESGLTILYLDFTIQDEKDLERLPKIIREKLKIDNYIEITSVGRL